MKNKIDIFSEDISSLKYQIDYIDAFMKKFGSYIDISEQPFYFCDNYIVNSITGETIKEILIERDSWKKITTILLKYFHIDI